MICSEMPSLKYSWSPSGLRSEKGKTAIDLSISSSKASTLFGVSVKEIGQR